MSLFNRDREQPCELDTEEDSERQPFIPTPDVTNETAEDQPQGLWRERKKAGISRKVILHTSLILSGVTTMVMLCLSGHNTAGKSLREFFQAGALVRFDGASSVTNFGKDCWMPCNGSGMCDGFCGRGNACCRHRSTKDPLECWGIVNYPTTITHTCVAPVNNVSVYHQGQDCWKHCGEKAGWCNWCGIAASCCRFMRSESVDCSGVTYWPALTTHTCVSPNLKPPGIILPPAPDATQCAPGEVQDANLKCVPSAGPVLMKFYMYRALDNEVYHMENSNLASLTGVMWYLQNEVVTTCPRRFGISRIVRYVITMRNPSTLWKPPAHSQFGPFVQFDDGKCSWNSSHCSKIWDKYGYAVGCQPLDTTSLSVPDYAGPPAPVWYSLPGRCPSMVVGDKSKACIAAETGGECVKPDGSADCTWKAELAGEIAVNDLSGIVFEAQFCHEGGLEYSPKTDQGVGTSFWNGRRNLTANRERVARVQQLFQLKYPTYPLTLGDPRCDWY